MRLCQVRSRFGSGPWVVALAVVHGCGPSDAPAARSPVETRLELVAALLAEYAIESGRRPAGEEEFRAYVERRGRERLERRGIRGVDELLTSPRDRRKFVILYEGSQPAIRGEIWAYEAAGHEGTRAVVDSLGKARLMPEEDFQRMRADA